jgi:hypothetical protein
MYLTVWVFMAVDWENIKGNLAYSVVALMNSAAYLFEQSENPDAVDDGIIAKDEMHLCAGEYAQYAGIQMLAVNFLDCVNDTAFSQDDIEQSYASYLISFDNNGLMDENSVIDIAFSPRTFKETVCAVLSISPGAHDEIAHINDKRIFDRENDSCFYIAMELMKNAYKTLLKEDLVKTENHAVYQMWQTIDNSEADKGMAGMDKVFSVIQSMAVDFAVERDLYSSITKLSPN